MIKAALTLEEVQTLCSNITITNVTKDAWFEVEESAKKIHGFKKLRDFNQAMSKEKELAETDQKNVDSVESVVVSEEIESEEVSDISEEEKVPDYDMDSEEDKVASVDCEIVTDQPDEYLDDDDDFSDDLFFQFFDLLREKIVPSIRKTGDYHPKTEEEHQILEDFFNKSEYSEEKSELYDWLKGNVEEELSPAQKLVKMGKALREQGKNSDELYIDQLRKKADDYEFKQLKQIYSEAEEGIKCYKWGKFTIRKRSDGYISLSDIFAASHVYKDYHEWFDEDETNEELLDDLSEDLSIPSVSYNKNVKALVQFVSSDNPEAHGIWGHKELALHLPHTLDPHFAVQCDELIGELMINGYVSLNQNSEQPMNYADELIRYGEALRRKEKIEEKRQQLLQKSDNLFA